MKTEYLCERIKATLDERLRQAEVEYAKQTLSDTRSPTVLDQVVAKNGCSRQQAKSLIDHQHGVNRIAVFAAKAVQFDGVESRQARRARKRMLVPEETLREGRIAS